MTPVFSCGIVGLMVSAPASHADGMEFDPGRCQIFLKFRYVFDTNTTIIDECIHNLSSAVDSALDF